MYKYKINFLFLYYDGSAGGINLSTDGMVVTICHIQHQCKHKGITLKIKYSTRLCIVQLVWLFCVYQLIECFKHYNQLYNKHHTIFSCKLDKICTKFFGASESEYKRKPTCRKSCRNIWPERQPHSRCASSCWLPKRMTAKEIVKEPARGEKRQYRRLKVCKAALNWITVAGLTLYICV